MKHTIFILSFCLFGHIGHAQNFGILAGINLVEVKHTTGLQLNDDLIGRQLGYRFGPILQFELNDYIDLRTGILYSNRTYPVDFFNLAPFELDSYDTVMNFIDVPLLFHLNLTSWFSLYAGPVIAINIESKIKAPSNSVVVSGKIDDPRSPYILAQGGLNFKFGWFGLDLYVEKGFGEIYKGGEKDYEIYGLNLILWPIPSEDTSREAYYRSRLRN